MKFPPDLQRKVLVQLENEPDRCLCTEEDEPLVYVDNLTQRLSRWVWEQVRGELPRERYLLRRCDSWGCINPWHRDAITTARPPRDRCPNGHLYDPATDLPGRLRCGVCAAARLERRRKLYDPLAGIPNGAKTHCPREHRLSPDNVYVWKDRKGRHHRRCRQCTIERSRLSRVSVARGTVL
jgi:hypothetical protein